MFVARHTTLALAALALTGLAAARPAAAQEETTTPSSTTITAVSYDSASFDTYNAQFSLGYSFTTGANALDVTSVGYLNDGAAGLNATHDVQIYQITSGDVLNPLAGTALFGTPVSVTTTGSSPAYNTFSYTTLTQPVLLSANTQYEIVANNNGNGYGINAQNAVYGGGIIYGTSTYSASQTTPVFNGNTFGFNNIGNFGPNFTANTVPPAAAPEPSQFAVLGFAVLGLSGLILKARRKTAMAVA